MSLTLRATKGSQLTQTEMDNNLKEIGYLSSDIASATTTDLSTATGNKVKITGTTTITSFGTAAPIGTIRVVHFAGILTLTHGGSAIVLPGAISIQTVAGDVYEFIHEGSGLWRCIGWMMGDKRALIGTAFATYVTSATYAYNAIFNNSSLGATPSLNFIGASCQKGTMSANVTSLTLTLNVGTQHLDLIQDGTGSRTMTWPANFIWPNTYASGDKLLSTAAGARDHLVMFYDGTSVIANLMKGVA